MTEREKVFKNISNDNIMIDTLELSHSKFTQKYYICRDKEDNDFRIEDGTIKTFQAINFNLTIPSFSQEMNNTIAFSIDLINFELIKSLDNILNDFNDEKIKVITRTYQKSNPDFPLIQQRIFETADFQIKNNVLSVSAKTHDFILQKFPKEKFVKELIRTMEYV